MRIPNKHFISELTAGLPKKLKKKAQKDLKKVAENPELIKNAELHTSIIAVTCGAFRSNNCFFNTHFVMMNSSLPYQYKQGYVRKNEGSQPVEHCWLELDGHRLDVTPPPLLWKYGWAVYSEDEYLFFDLNKAEYTELCTSAAIQSTCPSTKNVRELCTDLSWVGSLIFNAENSVLQKYVHPHSRERQRVSLGRIRKIKAVLAPEELILVAHFAEQVRQKYVSDEKKRENRNYAVFSPVADHGAISKHVYKQLEASKQLKPLFKYLNIHRVYRPTAAAPAKKYGAQTIQI